MSFLSEIQEALAPLNIPLETGVFTGEAPDAYLVVVPMTENYEYYADDTPSLDVCEARISIFSKSNYQRIKKAVVNALHAADFTITLRQYIGYEPDTGYHHYNVDAEKYYDYETEDN